jgi:hypothetical protein
MMGETNMSTQNTETIVYGESRNQFVPMTKLTLDEIQQVIKDKIEFIRKNYLQIGFTEASLAVELDKSRAFSKKLTHLEWNEITDDYLATEIITTMDSTSQVIETLLHKIHSLRKEAVKAEKALQVYLAYKHSFIKNTA